MKKNTAGFHRLRRAYFAGKEDAKKDIKEDPDESEVISSEAKEWEPRKGRKPAYNRKLPWPTAEEKMKAERKRIFMDHILFLAKRLKSRE